MKFLVNHNKLNIHNLMEKLGYRVYKKSNSFVRRIGNNNFPRFHVYANNMEGHYELSMHLDQKGVCYENQVAHSGEYDGDELSSEKERILKTVEIL